MRFFCLRKWDFTAYGVALENGREGANVVGHYKGGLSSGVSSVTATLAPPITIKQERRIMICSPNKG